MSYPTFKLAAVAASLALAGLAPAGSVQAATVYKATLLGANENPPVASPGGGVAFLTIDGDLLTVSTTFSNLIGDVAAAHVHCCAPAPANVGVATQIPSFPGFPTGVTSGTYNQGFDLGALGTYNPAFVTANGGTAQGARTALLTALNGGQAYFNVHTSFAPGGEIRGQFALIPEPASWALMIAGFGIAGAAIRWRRAVFKT
ncbi:CHRD domain-containing protein [Phenylobacterium sp.]|uniref:CHRD domain-containing protein n=1 Tax=Phenylobacterium sp. TaxID=1871053 RepID=UPI0025E81C6B|nr:CHRD domain-containing protein [Phenylobacterium sp.]